MKLVASLLWLPVLVVIAYISINGFTLVDSIWTWINTFLTSLLGTPAIKSFLWQYSDREEKKLEPKLKIGIEKFSPMYPRPNSRRENWEFLRFDFENEHDCTINLVNISIIKKQLWWQKPFFIFKPLKRKMIVCDVMAQLNRINVPAGARDTFTDVFAKPETKAKIFNFSDRTLLAKDPKAKDGLEPNTFVQFIGVATPKSPVRSKLIATIGFSLLTDIDEKIRYVDFITPKMILNPILEEIIEQEAKPA